MDGDLSRPHLYEHRHSYNRTGFNLDMDGTRRLLWWETMAGGMGGFFGFYPDSPYPYPNPEQLRPHYTFWHAKNRFRLGMQRTNILIDRAYGLSDAKKENCVFYKDGTQSIVLDLFGMAHGSRIVAVYPWVEHTHTVI